MLLGLPLSHVTSIARELHKLLFFLNCPIFHCRLSSVNLGCLVHGDVNDCVVPPTACAVMELLEDIGESFYHNHYINFSLTILLSFNPDWESNII